MKSASLALAISLLTSGCTTMRPVSITEPLPEKLIGKEVTYSVRLHCSEEVQAEVVGLQDGKLLTSNGDRVETGELCALEKKQVELNPLYYAKNVLIFTVGLPIMIVAALAGSQCIMDIRC